MEIIYVLIGCSLLVALVFLGAFLWSVRNGQYRDTYTPAVRMLFDQEFTSHSSKATESTDSSTDSSHSSYGK